MSLLDELSSSTGDRTQTSNLAVLEKVKGNHALLDEIATGLTNKNVKVVGDCAEIFTKMAEAQPEIVVPYVPKLAPLLASKDKRVRWETTHSLLLVARQTPDQIAPLLPQLGRIITQDSSVIVRNYTIQMLGEYATTSSAAAQAAFPFLLEAVTAFEGEHLAVALVELAKAATTDPALAPKVIEIAQQHKDDEKSKVRQNARSALRKLGQKP